MRLLLFIVVDPLKNRTEATVLLRCFELDSGSIKATSRKEQPIIKEKKPKKSTKKNIEWVSHKDPIPHLL